MEFKYFALTDVGHIRANNEDAVAIDPAHGIAVVADGMGGYQAGEVASAMAVEVVCAELRRQRPALDAGAAPEAWHGAIRHGIEQANHAVFRASGTRPECAGMGTTLVVALLQRNRAFIGHVGDSRAYAWRDGVLTQLTRDHSLAQELIDTGLLAPTDPMAPAWRNTITRALGIAAAMAVDTCRFEMSAGDTLMLCSDGLSNMLADAQIATVLRQQASIETQARHLIDAANARGGHDNSSVVLVRACDPQPARDGAKCRP